VELQTDWKEFLRLLSRHGVRYVIVGGLAVGAHGRERYTKDLDVFVASTEANARRIGRVLVDFGFRATSRAWRRFTKPYQILILGREPNRIDILTSIAGVTFSGVWKGRKSVTTEIGTLQIIGLADLRRNKAATGRPIDLADLALLDELALAKRAKPRPRAK
jgi:hypothetical protein